MRQRTLAIGAGQGLRERYGLRLNDAAEAGMVAAAGRFRAGLYRSGRGEDWGLDSEPRHAGELVQTPRASRLSFGRKGVP